jgi:hypothetical protein
VTVNTHIFFFLALSATAVVVNTRMGDRCTLQNGGSIVTTTQYTSFSLSKSSVVAIDV